MTQPLNHLNHTVLAIDPGSRKLGWAVVLRRGQVLHVLASGTLRLDLKATLPQRLGVILTELTLLFDAHKPDALAIEAAFVHENPHTALVLGQARGLPIALAAARGLPVAEFPPATVKRMVVGSGRAEKSQVQEMVKLQLALAALPQEDEADALAVAITYHRSPMPTTPGADAPSQSGLTAAQKLWLAASNAGKRKTA
jgi:crossover junction endodeoxyribonuclease RuvC